MTTIRRAAPLILNAVGNHTATVIFLHGLGDTGHGWLDMAQHMRTLNRRLDGVKWILPNAPIIPITVNGGAHMPGWFDIDALGTDRALYQDPEEKIVKTYAISVKYCHSLIQEEISAGTPAERIVLGGFSQGGAMSIYAGLNAPFKLAGILCMSSWLALSEAYRKGTWPTEDANKKTPILMAHGSHDPVVPPKLAKTSSEILQADGYDVEYKTYDGLAHSASLEELNDVEAFLASRLPPLKG